VQVSTGSDDGDFLFDAGLNVGPARAFGIGSVWYGRQHRNGIGSI
jgi:hypothetical protein